MHKKQHSKGEGRADAQSIKSKNPDVGPQMMEGAHHFDKGYDSDNETFAPTQHLYPGAKERGNSYMSLNNEWQVKDAHKLTRSKFSKIA